MSAASVSLQAVPPWLMAGVGLTGAAAPFASTLIGLGIVDLVARARGRRVAGSHWTERAREAWTARLSFRLVLGMCCGLAAIGMGAERDAPCLPAGGAVLARVGGVVLACMVIAAGQRVRPPALATPSFVTPRSVAFWIALSPQQLGLLGFLLPLERVDAVALSVAGGLLVAAVLALRVGWPIALGLGLAREATPRAMQAVERAAERFGLRPRRVVELDPGIGNAWAFPLVGTVAFSRGALEALDDAQLTSVAVHEMGHLAEPRWVSWARWAVSLTWIPVVLVRPLIATFGSAGVLIAFGPMAAGWLAFRRLARRMEVGSDALAVDHEGERGVYATALERLYERGLLPAVDASRREVHPPLYDRLLAAGVQPAYPRPAPPKRLPALLGVGAMLVASIGVGAGEAVLQMRIGNDEDGRYPPELVVIALGCGPSIVASTATDLLYEGDRAGADRWYKIAHALDTTGETFSVHALALAAMGDCDGADEWSEAARERIESAGSSEPGTDGPAMWLATARRSSRLCRDRARGVAPSATAGAQQ